MRKGSLVAKANLPHGDLSGDGRFLLALNQGALTAIDLTHALPYREIEVLKARRISRLPEGLIDTLRFDENGAVVVWINRLSHSVVDGRPSFLSHMVSLSRFDTKGRFLARYPPRGEALHGDGLQCDDRFLSSSKADGLVEVRRLSDFRLVRMLRMGRDQNPSFGPRARNAASTVDARRTLRLGAGAPSPRSRPARGRSYQAKGQRPDVAGQNQGAGHPLPRGL